MEGKGEGEEGTFPGNLIAKTDLIFLQNRAYRDVRNLSRDTAAPAGEPGSSLTLLQSDMSVKCVYGMKDSDSVTYEVQFDGQLSALVSPVYLITHSTRPDLSALWFRETENPVAPRRAPPRRRRLLT